MTHAQATRWHVTRHPAGFQGFATGGGHSFRTRPFPSYREARDAARGLLRSLNLALGSDRA